MVAFSIFTRLCNHPLCLIPEHFHNPKKPSYPLEVTAHPLSSTSGNYYFVDLFFLDTS